MTPQGMVLLLPGVATSGNIRLILFVLVIVAVMLIVAGCMIAVFTLQRKRKESRNSPQLESKST